MFKYNTTMTNKMRIEEWLNNNENKFKEFVDKIGKKINNFGFTVDYKGDFYYDGEKASDTAIKLMIKADLSEYLIDIPTTKCKQIIINKTFDFLKRYMRENFHELADEDKHDNAL